MRAGAQRGDAHVHVHPVRRAHADQVKLLRLEHLIQVGVTGGRGMLAQEALATVVVGVTERGQFDVLAPRIRVYVVSANPQADDRRAQPFRRTHRRRSSWLLSSLRTVRWSPARPGAVRYSAASSPSAPGPSQSSSNTFITSSASSSVPTVTGRPAIAASVKCSRLCPYPWM